MSRLTVKVDGLPECANAKVIITAKPRTEADFESVVEALGGPENLRLGYRAEDLIYTEDDGAIYLALQPPADHPGVRPDPGHPFIREFAKRIAPEKAGDAR